MNGLDINPWGREMMQGDQEAGPTRQIELTEQPQALSEQETEATHQLDIPLNQAPL